MSISLFLWTSFVFYSLSLFVYVLCCSYLWFLTSVLPLPLSERVMLPPILLCLLSSFYLNQIRLNQHLNILTLLMEICLCNDMWWNRFGDICMVEQKQMLQHAELDAKPLSCVRFALQANDLTCTCCDNWWCLHDLLCCQAIRHTRNVWPGAHNTAS